MNEFPVPEIVRCPLEPILLQIIAYGIENDPREFDFIERPSYNSMNHALERLGNLQALDIMTYKDAQDPSFTREKITLTPLGRVLSVLPVDVVLGKMLLLGSISELVDPTLVVAASLSVSSPFVRVAESNVNVIKKREDMFSDHGDPFTLLNLFSEWLRIKAEKSVGSSF